ncbi:MAG: hypothetical protein H7145_13560 [Akkermansiaceae bacterium]|nr:hypothetical protein [Armatimonadota bacterium]
MSFDKDLQRLSRGLPSTAPPPRLRDRIFNELPAPTRSLPIFRFAAAGVIVAGIVAFFFTPARVQPTFAQEMRSAVAEARTWHFVGWRLRNGRRVRWEIWGRRSPYFYREQIGGDIQIEDGTRRLRLIPPDPDTSYGRKIGFAILLPPNPLPTEPPKEQGNEIVSFARGMGSDYLAEADFSEQGRTADGRVSLRSRTLSSGNTDRVTVIIADTQSKLPIRLGIHSTSHKGRPRDYDYNRPVEGDPNYALLDARYNVPLPEDVAAHTIPDDYRRIDFTQVPSPTSLPDGSTTKNGLTLQGEAIAQDAEGNVLLRFQALFGNEPFRDEDLPLQLEVLHEQFDGMGIAMTAQRDGSVRYARDHFATDDLGNHYLTVSRPPTVSKSDAPEMYLVPVEPFAPSAPRPTRLTVQVEASPSFWDDDGGQMRTVPFLQEKMSISLPLPPVITPLGYDTASSPEIITRERRTLNQEAAAARSSYYGAWRSFGDPPPFFNPEIAPDLKRASYWAERAK